MLRGPFAPCCFPSYLARPLRLFTLQFGLNNWTCLSVRCSVFGSSRGREDRHLDKLRPGPKEEEEEEKPRHKRVMVCTGVDGRQALAFVEINVTVHPSSHYCGNIWKQS